MGFTIHLGLEMYLGSIYIYLSICLSIYLSIYLYNNIIYLSTYTVYPNIYRSNRSPSLTLYILFV